MPVVPHRPLNHYYADTTQREEFVRGIFDETAPWYDWADRFLSLGSGNWYRREAVKRVGLAPGMKLLDLATGTGPVTRAAAELTKDPRSIVGMDASIGMLLSGRTGSPKIHAPAESLPCRDRSFDRITIGFALRHFVGFHSGALRPRRQNKVDDGIEKREDRSADPAPQQRL